ncbi:MAG: rod shape-determining protein RodA [Lentisphaeria bacterium]|nr:rod shape-determining protein RodA [Lentisphaeria bacterium]
MIFSGKKHTPASRAGHGGGFFADWDWLQLLAVLGLLGIGLLFIHSTGENFRAAVAFSRQVQWIGLGSLLFLICACIDYRNVNFKFLTLPAYLLVVVLLMLTLRFGVRISGATRWLDIGSFRIQPSEFAKLAMVLLLSVIVSLPRFEINKKGGMLAGVLVFLIPFLLIAKEPDLGSALVLVPAFAGMVFCAGLKWRYIVIFSAAVLLIGSIAVLNETLRIKPLLREYQRDRIRVFLDPESDRLHRGYNAYQARLAVGSGGFLGKGIGQGEQNNLGYLPHTVANNDFIFSVIAEETGFAGALILLLLYALLLYSIWRTAFRAADPMGRAIAVGIGCVISFHVFINIGMSVGLAPVTGVPLPFVSYGGSFLLSSMAMCGILQSVYRKRRREL